MDISEIWRKAEEDANRDAPPPKFNPWEGGFGAAVAAMIVLWVFCAILNLDTDYPKAQRAIAITITLVGAVVFFMLRHQEKKHWAVRSRRIRELTNAADIKNTDSHPLA